MKTITSKTLFIFAFLLIAVTNIVILAGIAYNRSASCKNETTLSERELKIPYRTRKENSGISLRIVWRVPGDGPYHNNYSHRRKPDWLNAEKLQQLGFSLTALNNATGYSRQAISREVFVVLENNGKAYREAIKTAKKDVKEKENINLQKNDKESQKNLKRAKENLQYERLEGSRLFVIDAGLDPDKLREKYNEHTSFIITRALIKPGFTYENKKKKVVGYIKRLSIGAVHVPLQHRDKFETSRKPSYSNNNSLYPHYRINIAYGCRFEPWILAVQQEKEE